MKHIFLLRYTMAADSGSSLYSHEEHSKVSCRTEEWDPSSFAFQVDYNDHFETPFRAYQDIQPLLDWLAVAQRRSKETTSIYDPYYCNGLSKQLLKKLGYRKVIHEKRDFYMDLKNGSVPGHDILITNPPYSSNHKQRFLEFAVQQLVSEDRHFFLLLPNYVVAKQYYQQIATSLQDDGDKHSIFYLVPTTLYHYEHPEGTGKPTCPFESLWYCGIAFESLEQKIELQRRYEGLRRKAPDMPELILDLEQLQRRLDVFAKRPNPQQRKRRRRKQQRASDQRSLQTEAAAGGDDDKKRGQSNKKSKYRDGDGKRTKRRF